MKLRRAVFLGFGLKGVKIARNVVKVRVNASLSNGYPNPLSSFNYEKLVKSETPSYNFVRVWLKEAENSSEHHESWCTLLPSKCASKSIIEF